MAIQRCETHELWWDGDCHTECPMCALNPVTDAMGGEHVVSFALRLVGMARHLDVPFFGTHNGRALFVTKESKARSLVDQWDRIGAAIATGTRQTIPINDDRSALIRKLMDRFPFDAESRPLYDECKRVLGEA